MSKTIYIDHTTMEGAIGLVLRQGVKVVYTGTEVTAENDETAAAEVSRLCGVNFFLKAPEVPFYSVPYLEVFASDGQGGWFAMTLERTNGPLYYIAPDRTPHLVTDYFQALFSLAVSDPDWRRKYLPGTTWPRLPEDPEGRRKLGEALRLPASPPDELHPLDAPPRLFASRAEAEKEHPIQDVWTVLRDGKSPRFQVHPMMSPPGPRGPSVCPLSGMAGDLSRPDAGAHFGEAYPGALPEIGQ